MVEELMNLDAIAQAELVRSGEVTALELVEGAISRIEQTEDLNVVTGLNFDLARRRAAAALEGPLAGVPFLIKDLTPYPGFRHTMGSRLFADNVAQESTPLSQRFDEAGLVVLGKTTTSELGLLGSTESLLSGASRNPWDPTRSAGGSSGGSAAAVAARIVPMAHATDGGGSIRIPAAMNGVFGLKPSSRRTFNAGTDDLEGLVVDHCVSWSVRDSALLLSLTEQPIAGLPPVGFVDGPTSERMTIGVYRTSLMGRFPSSAVDAAVESTVRLCRDLGHRVVDIRPPAVDGPAISDAFFTLAGAALTQLSAGLESVFGRSIGADDLEPFTLGLIRRFQAAGPAAVERAHQTLSRCERAMNDLVEPYDAVLSPTIPIDLPPLGFLAPNLDTDELIDRTEYLAGYTAIHNMAKVPAMSVPLNGDDRGWPIGSHFAASYGDEAKLLRLAYELEAAAPWRARHPKK